VLFKLAVKHSSYMTENSPLILSCNTLGGTKMNAISKLKVDCTYLVFHDAEPGNNDFIKENFNN